MTTKQAAVATTKLASKCLTITSERTCLATDGCGWCIDNSYNNGCMPSPYTSNLPWTNSYGEVLKNCDKGWQT